MAGGIEAFGGDLPRSDRPKTIPREIEEEVIRLTWFTFPQVATR